MSFQTFNKAFSVTPNDKQALPQGECKALYVGGPSGLGTTLGVSGGGKLTVKCKEPNFDYKDPSSHVGVTAGIVTFENVPVGTIIPIKATHVMATDTDATNIVSLH